MWWNSIRNPLETFGAFEMVALKVFGFETPIFRGAPTSCELCSPTAGCLRHDISGIMPSVAFQDNKHSKTNRLSDKHQDTRWPRNEKRNSCRAEADNDSSNAWAMQVGCMVSVIGFFDFPTSMASFFSPLNGTWWWQFQRQTECPCSSGSSAGEISADELRLSRWLHFWPRHRSRALRAQVLSFFFVGFWHGGFDHCQIFVGFVELSQVLLCKARSGPKGLDYFMPFFFETSFNVKKVWVMFSGSLSVISAVFRSFPCAKQGHMVHRQQSTHQLRGCRLQQPIWGQTLGISHVTRIGWDAGTCVGQSLKISRDFFRPDVEGAKLRPQGWGGIPWSKLLKKMDAFLQPVPNPAVFGNYLPGVMMPFPMPFLSQQSGSVKPWVPFMDCTLQWELYWRIGLTTLWHFHDEDFQIPCNVTFKIATWGQRAPLLFKSHAGVFHSSSTCVERDDIGNLWCLSLKSQWVGMWAIQLQLQSPCRFFIC